MGNKLPKPQYKQLIDFIRDKADLCCQICGRAGQDIAHKDRGYKRDDRYIALLCRECHQKADQPSYKQIEESKAINTKLKNICLQNWEDFKKGDTR